MTFSDPEERFVADVLARTSGPACGRARVALAGRLDDSLDDSLDETGGALLADHLRHCDRCRAVAERLPSLVSALPALAEEPLGSDFTARVLAATSERPRAPRWRERWAAWWASAALRPRFAWEAAYVLTLFVVLVTGNPVRAWDAAAERWEHWPRPSLQGGLTAAPAVIARVEGPVRSRAESARTWVQRQVRAGGLEREIDEALGTWRRAWAAVTEIASAFTAQVSAWLERLRAALRPPATEPAGDAPRSMNQTEITR
jgi:hypothetical protein